MLPARLLRLAFVAGGLAAALLPATAATRERAERPVKAEPRLPHAAFAPAPQTLPTVAGEATLLGPTFMPTPATPAAAAADVVYAAYQRGLWLAAFALAIPRAEAGDAAAMTMLGTLYETGLGVKPSEAKAIEWYRHGADAGDREAMSALALMTLEGRGVARDPKAAYRLFRAAAEKDQPVALFNAAMMLFDGTVVPRDADTATRFLARAADLGNIEAQYAYATALADPDNPHHDATLAAHWMREAALAGFDAAEIEFGLMLANGRGVPKDLASAFVWLHRSALRGNAIGRNRLARMYAVGLGVDADPVEAWKWHTLAKRQGLSDLWLETRLADMSDADRRRAEAAADAIAGLDTERPPATPAVAPAASGAATKSDAAAP